MKRFYNPNKKNLNYNASILNKLNIPKNCIRIYGYHACKSALENNKREKVLILTNEKNLFLWEKIIIRNNLDIKLISVNSKDLDLISNYNVHQNVILIAKPLKKIILKDYLKNNNYIGQKVILLDQISDPQNIGSIIRSAFAFGFDAVCLTKNNSPFETSSLIKASSGEIEKIKLIELGNLIREINLLKTNGFYVYGLSNYGKNNIKSIDKIDNKIALVLGSESKGLRNLTEKNVDQILHIPINKNCNSLNASNAAAIAMYELGNILL